MSCLCSLQGASAIWCAKEACTGKDHRGGEIFGVLGSLANKLTLASVVFEHLQTESVLFCVYHIHQ